MTSTRTFVFVGLAVVAFALFGGRATVGQDGIDLVTRQNERGSLRQTAEPSDVVTNLSREVARLRERLQRGPVPQNISRNPFLFVTEELEVESVASPRPTRGIPDPVGENSTTATNGLPTFSFIGVARDADQRTAILVMDDGQVAVVGAGDAVTDQYRVGAIEENAITIIDPNGIVRRYELR